MKHLKAIAGLVVAVALATAVYAQQKAGKVLTAQDYAEIQQLYARFAWAIDSAADNGRMYANTFTPDGEFHFGKDRYIGRDNLAQLIMNTHAKSKPAPHLYTGNVWVEPSAEGARGGAYVMSVASPDEGKPAAISWTGTYEDILVKAAEGWRIKQRTLYMNAMPPTIMSVVSK